MRKRGWGEEGLQVNMFRLLLTFRFRLRQLGLIAVNFPGEAEHGRWEARLVYTWACQQSHCAKHSQLWNWVEVGNFTVEGSLKMFPRCDTPELDWSGGEDEEGGLRSSSRMFETASAFNTSNIIELRLETERLASMVSLLCKCSQQFISTEGALSIALPRDFVPIHV